VLLSVVDESPDWLVIDKPAGLVCHPTKNGELSSLIGRVRLYLGHADGRLVNRLDRETSGLVVIAKHREAARELGQLFAADDVEKTYIAIVHGHLPAGDLAIAASLGKDADSSVAIKDCVRDDGAPADTRVRRVAVFTRAEGEFSVAEVRPRTGRKHQIRIHLAHAGFPIAGDKIYGGDETRYLRLVTGALTDADRRALMLPHHALHAATLVCTLNGQRRRWSAPEPEMLRRFQSGLTMEDLWERSREERRLDPGAGPSLAGE
jgi:23S rRNA pseudouridine1911/1915/1917 synthase